jgi:hypothetical protein
MGPPLRRDALFGVLGNQIMAVIPVDYHRLACLNSHVVTRIVSSDRSGSLKQGNPTHSLESSRRLHHGRRLRCTLHRMTTQSRHRANVFSRNDISTFLNTTGADGAVITPLTGMGVVLPFVRMTGATDSHNLSSRVARGNAGQWSLACGEGIEGSERNLRWTTLRSRRGRPPDHRRMEADVGTSARNRRPLTPVGKRAFLAGGSRLVSQINSRAMFSRREERIAPVKNRAKSGDEFGEFRFHLRPFAPFAVEPEVWATR